MGAETDGCSIAPVLVHIFQILEYEERLWVSKKGGKPPAR